LKPQEIPLEEGKFYHIYNRGNNGSNLFYKKENYNYFLRKYNEYLSGYVDTYSYCLLPNHFHLLVSIKELETKVPPFKKVEPLIKRAEPLIKPVEPLFIKKTEPLDASTISFQFRKFFTSYSMSINKQEDRTGSLFQKNFKRKQITDVNYLANLVFYIHANPQLHGISVDFKTYEWSSYNTILSDKPTKLNRSAVINWFDDKENFIAYHAQKIEFEKIKDLILEDK
jgi:putative transposase